MGNIKEGLVNKTTTTTDSRNTTRTRTNMLGNEEITTMSPSRNTVSHGFNNHSDPEMSMKVMTPRTRTMTTPLTRDPPSGVIVEQEDAKTPVTATALTKASGELFHVQSKDDSTNNSNTIHHNGYNTTNTTSNTNVNNHSPEPLAPAPAPPSESLQPSRSPVEPSSLEPSSSSSSSLQPSERYDPRRVSSTSTTNTAHTTTTTATDTLMGKRKHADITSNISNSISTHTAIATDHNSNTNHSGESTTEEAGLSLLFAASLMQQPPHPPLPSTSPSPVGLEGTASTPAPTPANKKHPIQNTSVITNPEKSDVLCGRGGQINKHKGNIVYRRVVEFNKAVYKQVPKQQRCLVSQSIVQTVVNHGGRFLQQEQDVWKEIPFRRAVQKTSQALREPSAASTSGSNSSADGEGADADADADTEHSVTDPGMTAAAVAAAVDSIDIATTHAASAGDVENDDEDDDAENDGEVTSTSTGEASGEQKQKQTTSATGTTSTATLLVAA